MKYLRSAFFILLLQLPASLGLAQWSSSGNNIFNSNTGNVGIGTTVIPEKLVVAGNIKANSFVTADGKVIVTDWRSYQNCVTDYNNCSDWYYDGPDFYCIGYATICNQNLVIDNINTRIGIGVANPTENLHVNGNVKTNSKFVFSDGSFLSSSKGYPQVSLVNISPDRIESPNLIRTFNYKVIYDRREDNFFDGTQWYVPEYKYMIGVGTNNPTEKLDVSGYVKAIGFKDANGNLLVSQWTKNGNNLSYTLGNVGIGTNTPSARLEVVGTGGTNIDFVVNGRLKSNNNDGGLWISSDRFMGGHTVNKIGFYNNGWQLTVQNDGNVGIGTITPSAKLDVNGSAKVNGNLFVSSRIDAYEFRACLNPGSCPDYVFEDNYKLMDLKSLKDYLKKNKHLPEVPSAKEMESTGMDMKAMNILLLKKVEELTLYMLEMKSEMDQLKKK